jgi:hypothetical protein
LGDEDMIVVERLLLKLSCESPTGESTDNVVNEILLDWVQPYRGSMYANASIFIKKIILDRYPISK